MSPEMVPALSFSIVQLSEIMTACFRQYLVPIAIGPGYFAARFGAEGINYAESRVWMQQGEPIAIALVTTRDIRARIAAFAISPDWRGKGLAKPMMAALLSQLAARHYVQVSLEAIEENSAALALYQTQGFQTVQRLVGFQGSTPADAPATALLPAAPDPLLRAVWRTPPQEIPWLLDPIALAGLPCQVWRDGEHAWAAIDQLTATPQLRYLFVDPEYRHRGLATAMLRKINTLTPASARPSPSRNG